MEYASPSKEELLASINPDMRLTKSFIKRIYGYGVTDPDFPDKAIVRKALYNTGFFLFVFFDKKIE